MLSGMIDLAKLLGQPAIYLVLSLIMLVWGAKSYIGLRKAMSQDYRESVQETLRITTQLQSAATTIPELVPIKEELLRRLGVVDRNLASAERHIIADTSLDVLLAPEPMLVMGAAGALVMLVTNLTAIIFQSSSNSVYTALGLSCMMALLVFKSQRSWPIRILYYILVAVAIFSLGYGLNALGQEFTAPPRGIA